MKMTTLTVNFDRFVFKNIYTFSKNTYTLSHELMVNCHQSNPQFIQRIYFLKTAFVRHFVRHFMLSETQWIFRLDEQEMMNDNSIPLHLIDHHRVYSLHKQKIKWNQFENLRRISDLTFLCNRISFPNSVWQHYAEDRITPLSRTLIKKVTYKCRPQYSII